MENPRALKQNSYDDRSIENFFAILEKVAVDHEDGKLWGIGACSRLLVFNLLGH